MSGKGPQIIVAGAGIIGASIAWHLTRGGGRVTVFDAGEAGGVATPNSFSWINSNYSFARPYFALRHHSMGEWRRLSRVLPQLPVSLSGSLYLPAPGVDLEKFVKRNRAWGYRIELIDGARFRELEPHWRHETGLAARAGDEGAAEAEEVAQCLVAAAVEEGAVLRAKTRIEGLVFSHSGVCGVRVNGETVPADEVIVAAGTATAELVSPCGFELPLTAPPGILVHTAPVAPLLNSIVLADGLHIRQKPGGELLAGADNQGTELDGDPEASAEILMQRMRAALPGGDALALAGITTGYRPTPGDGLPVLGRAPGVSGLYIAVMHSGVTLCPAVGDFAAREILTGARDTLLAPFGPERFGDMPRAAAVHGDAGDG